jgi:predicted DNA-binding transcriptional regulator AlpA
MSELPARTYDRDAVAALLHITPGTVTKYVARGTLPEPAGHIGGRSPWWHANTIDTWLAARPAHPNRKA